MILILLIMNLLINKNLVMMSINGFKGPNMLELQLVIQLHLHFLSINLFHILESWLSLPLVDNYMNCIGKPFSS